MVEARTEVDDPVDDYDSVRVSLGNSYLGTDLDGREDEIYARWCAWLTRIDTDLTQLALARWTFRTLSAMTQTADLPPSFAFEVLSDWYVRAQATGVRRQTEIHPDAASLATLLDRMATHPEVMTRDRYLSLAPNDEYLRMLDDRHFDRVAGAGSNLIPPERPREAIERLQVAALPVKRYVDRIVAHQDRRETSLPTYEDLDTALDTIEHEFRTWNGWLTGTDRIFMVPVPQYDWLAPFRVAWLRSDNEAALPPHPFESL